MLVYDYLFYRLYKILGIGGDRDVAEWSAVILISLLEFFNIVVLFVFLAENFGSNVFFKSKIATVLFLVLLVVINYFVFIYRDRYINILEKFKDESVIAKYSTFIFTLIYISFSVWSLIS